MRSHGLPLRRTSRSTPPSSRCAALSVYFNTNLVSTLIHATAPGSPKCRRNPSKLQDAAEAHSGCRSARPTRRLINMRHGGCASGSAVSTRCGPGNTCASRPSGSGPITGSRILRRVRRAFRGRRHDLVREPDAGNLHVRFDERRLETKPRRGVGHRNRRKPPATATPFAYRHRASRRLYTNLVSTLIWGVKVMRRRYETTKREERESEWTLAYDFFRSVR